jgi:hypothetical protein
MSEGQNGAPMPQMGPPVNAEAVIQLRQHLAACEAGHTSTIGLISIDHNGNAAMAWSGVRLVDIYIACDTIKKHLLDSFNKPQNQSRILRARPGP